MSAKHQHWLMPLLLTLACAEPLTPNAPTPREGSVNLPKERGVANAQGLGTLSYSSLRFPEGSFQGRQLLISNNPEHVYGYGLLASTGLPAPAMRRSPSSSAPTSDRLWQDQQSWYDTHDGCDSGEASSLSLYLAHILDGSMGWDRRLSIILEGGVGGDVVLDWRSALGTTAWSDEQGLKTARPDWLGVRISESVLDGYNHGGSYDGRLTLRPRQRVVLDTIRADSLVEGFAQLDAVQGCFKVHVVAHDGDDPMPKIGFYAPGDVKWPGWFQGRGFGRAAGVYEAERWTGTVSLSIDTPRFATGWVLLNEETSPSAIFRYADSAAILFGGYGVTYELQGVISNDLESCVSSQIGLTSYARFSSDNPLYDERARTPSWSTLELNTPNSFPSMLWNGPVNYEHQLRSGGFVSQKVTATLTVQIEEEEKQDPTKTIKSMTKPLFRMDLNPGEQRSFKVTLPVPGYIVAPIAITAETSPCTTP